MNISYELAKWLTADATIANKLADANAITPGDLPAKAAFPHLTLENERDGSRAKIYGGRSRIKRTYITLNVWAKEYPQMKELDGLLKDKLDNHSGAIGAVAKASVTARVVARVPDSVRDLHRAIIELTIKSRS